MVETAPSAAGRGGARRFLTFRMDARLYALPAEEVSEVIRTPPVARVPQAPRGLMGMANLRGDVLPVASLRGLLGQDQGDVARTPRAIVLDGAAPVALAVDFVDALVSVDAERLSAGEAALSAEPGERLRGFFRIGAEGAVARILDIQGLLADAFAQPPRRQRAARAAEGAAGAAHPAQALDDRQRLVTFEVAGQEYALALGAVQEIIESPAAVAAVARGEALVLGVAGYRDGLLPLLSLRGLLGFPAAAAADGREKVVVTRVGAVLVGLVVDRTRAIVSADPALVEPPPPVLAARAGGESQIGGIYRGEGGRRLISILSPERLFGEEVMQRLSAGRAAPETQVQVAADGEGEALRFLVFRLGDDEFGLPIEAVDEVARVPEQITRLPKTPKFLEGVINLRGEVLPVVDQRRRFDMPPLEAAEGRRLVVVRSQAHRAGLIVDSVSEVLRTTRGALEPAPNLTGQATRLVNAVVNLQESGRLVLLLDPAELLSRAERGLLDAFAPGAEQAGP